MQVSLKPVLAKGDGCVENHVGVVKDVTARHSADEAMHLCDKALAATSEAMLITDASQRDNPILYCNAAFTKLLGAALLARALSCFCGGAVDTHACVPESS